MKKYGLPLISFIMFTIFGCSPTREDYSALTTWEYINESSYSLDVEGGEEILNFNIAENAKHSFEVKIRTDNDITENTFTSPYDPVLTKITLDGEQVITKSKITDRENYTAKKVADRHYQFTYTFINEDFQVE